MAKRNRYEFYEDEYLEEEDYLKEFFTIEEIYGDYDEEEDEYDYGLSVEDFNTYEPTTMCDMARKIARDYK